MTPFMTTFVNGVGWALIHFVWQGTILGCCTALALRLMGGSRPEHRYAIACIGLFMCFALPALETWRAMVDGGDETLVWLLATASEQSASSIEGSAIVAMLSVYLPGLVAGWSLCAVLLSMRLCLGLMWIRGMRKQGVDDEYWQGRVALLSTRFDVRRIVRILVVTDLSGPITAGWLRPVIFVPAALLTGMAPDMLEALLAHEMAHIKRHDYLINLCQNAVEILLFFHPAVWWISHQIRTEREQMADDFAARKLGEPRRLALALSELERLQFSTHHLAQAAHGGDLMLRIKRLVQRDPKAVSWKASISVLGFAVACMALYAQASAVETGNVASSKVSAPKFVDMDACKPVYPQESIKKLETGTVDAKFTISSKGILIGSEIMQSSGYKLLDDATLAGLGKCKFIPGTKNGKPAKATMKIQYVWKLED